MALADSIRNAVATAKATLKTGKLLVPVTLQTLASTMNDYGERAVSSTTTYDALVEDVDVVIRDVNGIEVTAAQRVTFLEKVTITDGMSLLINGVAGGPIIRIDRTVLDKDGQPLVVLVYLGQLVARSQG